MENRVPCLLPSNILATRGIMTGRQHHLAFQAGLIPARRSVVARQASCATVAKNGNTTRLLPPGRRGKSKLLHGPL